MHQGNYNYYAHKSVCTGDFVLFINTCVEANKYILFSRQVVATSGLNSFSKTTDTATAAHGEKSEKEQTWRLFLHLLRRLLRHGCR